MRFIAVGGRTFPTELDAIRLSSTVVLSPPVTLWPSIERRGQLPSDVEELVAGGGLLLRTDIHTLFDLGLLAVDTNTMTVVTSRALADSEYTRLNGGGIHVPAQRDRRPSIRALDQHREKAGLTRHASDGGRTGKRRG